jgi:hypothetical protein
METTDFFRCRIDAMINLNDPLAVLATRLPWNEIEAALAPMFAHKDRAGQASDDVDLFGPTLAVAGAGRSNAGRPRLPIRLMSSLLYLKHSFNLSDEEVAQRWSENVLWQFFSGMAYYEHRLPCDATQIGRFRVVVGEAGLEQMLKATINAAVGIGAIKPEELERVIVDTTVQVRREVAYIIVSPAHKAGDETGCSVSRSLPVHASLAMAMCEATGTKRRAFWPRHLPRGSGVTCEHQCGRGARLSDRVNTCELPQASLS